MNEEIKTTVSESDASPIFDVDDADETSGKETEVTTEEDNKITLTQSELDKKIQSETDKIRTKYSKEIKELKDKIATLIPKELTPAEIEMESRLKTLEKKQQELDGKERFLNLQTSLSEHNLPKSMATQIKDDIDVTEFAKAIDDIVAERVKGKGYQPTTHTANEGVTQDMWNAMVYSQRAELYAKNPELYKKYIN
jgi:Fe2+ transport system protein B